MDGRTASPEWSCGSTGSGTRLSDRSDRIVGGLLEYRSSLLAAPATGGEGAAGRGAGGCRIPALHWVDWRGDASRPENRYNKRVMIKSFSNAALIR